MPIHFRENQYRGVNAHLQSHFQETGGDWVSFHNRHTVYICDAINQQLPRGYYARNEASLQVIEAYIGEGPDGSRRTYPDVAIVERDSGHLEAATTILSTAPTATMPTLASLVVSPDYLDSVVIYYRDGDKIVPITRLELLSPSNKPPRASYRPYQLNRDQTIRAGVNLVEIDYLHALHPILPQIPSYRERERGAHPYYLLVSNTYPSLEEGLTSVYGFGIDEPIPACIIPLRLGHHIQFDLNAVYQHTFQNDAFYGDIEVDYEQPPARFEMYTGADQAKIHAVMQRAAEKAAALPPVPDVE